MARHQMNLFIHAMDETQMNQLKQVLELFHQAQDVIELTLRGERQLPRYGNRVNWDQMVPEIQPETPEIYITGDGLADNWFTHTHQKIAIISMRDWEVAFLDDDQYPIAAPDANLLLSFALVIFLILINGTDYDVVHERTIGCLCDLCAHKPDRAIKMRTAFICNRCRKLASQSGVSAVELDAIQAVCECVRALALGRTPQTHAPKAQEDVLDNFIEDSILPGKITIPIRLMEACREKRVTVVVGSGLSLQNDVRIIYGDKFGWTRLPSWSEVPQRLSRAVKYYRNKTIEPRDVETLEEFLTDLDYFRTVLGEKMYYPRAIFDIFTPKIENPGLANRLIYRLPIQWILTTNYDFVLSYSAPPGTPVFTWREAMQAREYIDSGNYHPPLLKIHGCASRADTIVLTKSEYRQLGEHAEYLSLMNTVFQSQVVLFLGFGFSDPLDIDSAIRQAELAGAAQGEKFALLPIEKANAIQEKFANIHVITYEQHDDLPKIIAHLVKNTGGH
ncbi:MAG: SIR2 family protein [Anaerolineaceae bacterium]|nr:SIR2 family protein [Anaerolineaceae bacterium]